MRIYYVRPKPLSVPESGERPGFVLFRFPLVSQSLEPPIRRSIPSRTETNAGSKIRWGQAHTSETEFPCTRSSLRVHVHS